MEKILVVGGSGMLGRQIAEGLSKDFEVIIFDRNKRTNLQTVQFDILDSRRFKEEFRKHNFKAAIHLVGSKNVTSTEKSSFEEVKKLNLDSLSNLLESCQGTNTRIIFSSSAAVYGKLPTPHSEKLEPAPSNAYGQVKRACEELLINASNQKKVRCTIFRIFSVYSKEDDKLLIGKMFSALKTNEEVTVKNINQVRDFVHIDDLVEVVRKTISLGLWENEVVNIGSGKGYKLSEVVDIFEKNSSLRINREVDDPAISYDSIADITKLSSAAGIKTRDILEEIRQRIRNEGAINESHQKFFENKVVCITGGLGSIGQDLVKGLLKFNPKKIIIVDNRETELFYVKSYPLSEKISAKFADVREYSAMEKVLENVDIVFHAAAMKHVVVCEDNPFEAVRTNVVGTNNVIEACLKNKVKKMILISTDKAVNPTSVMGATKLLAEKLVGAIATSTKLKENPTTEFGIVRFGNVLYSRGSVLEIWNKQIKERREISVTDETMTRFFMATSDCVNLIFHAATLSKEGEIFVLKMPSIKIGDLARAFSEVKNLPSTNIRNIGVRKGEKRHEELLLEDDGNVTLEDANLFVKFPSYTSESRVKEMKDKGFKETVANVLISNNAGLLSVEQIKGILLREKKIIEE